MNIGKEIEKRTKQFILKVITRIFISRKERSFPERFKKVLIVRIDERLGNLLLLLPVVWSIKYKAEKIELLIAKKYAEVLDIFDLPVHRVIYFEKKKLYNIFYLLWFIHFLRRKKYDLIIDGGNPNSLSFLQFIVIMLLRGNIKAGFLRDESGKILNFPIERPKTPVHIFKYYEILLRNLKIKYKPDYKIKIKIQKQNRIIIFAGGRGKKRWQKENIIEFLTLLKRDKKYKNYEIKVLLGPDEIDLREYFLTFGYKIETPKNIKELIEILRKAKYFIGSDSGPLHLAWILKCKIIGIFRPDSAKVFAHHTNSKIIITRTPARVTGKQVYNLLKEF